MKKTRILSILLALVLMLALPFSASAASFKDVKGDYWASYEINRLVSKGVIKGYADDNTFRPENNVTRAQAAIMLTRLLNLDTTKESSVTYTDVAKDHYAYKEISAVTNAGFMKGSNEQFRPEEKLTRAQMAIILTNAFELKGNGTAAFNDVAKDHFAYAAIDALYTNKITTGTSQNTFDPNKPVTRAQFSVFLSRVIDNENLNAPIVKELKEIYKNEYNLNSYEFEGTMNFGFDIPNSAALSEDAGVFIEMLKDINVDFNGVYQKDPMQLEMNMTLKMNGVFPINVNIPVVMTDEKMWVQIPDLPIGEAMPEELKGKFIEMDFAELSAIAGETAPTPVIDYKLQSKLNEAMYDAFFNHFGADYYKEVSKDAVKVPEGVEVDKVIKFEVTKEELAPFIQRLLNKFLPEALTALENPEFAKALGITTEDVKLIKEGLAESKVEIGEFVGEINQYVTLNALNEYIAVHPDKYIGYDVLNFDITLTNEGESLGIKFGYKFGKSKVNETPNFVIGIPSGDKVIKIQDLMSDSDFVTE